MGKRFSSADAAWLHMDRPTNLMVINSVLLFDEPVDWERYRELVQRRLVDRYPRFSQLAVESRLPLTPPKWVSDPHFDLNHHLHHIALPEPGDAAALQALVSDLMTTPLDRSRPLWHTYLVDGFGEGATLITRMHHCIADGISLARVMLSLTDSEPDAVIGPELDSDDGEGRGLFGDLVGFGAEVAAVAGRACVGVARQGALIAFYPRHAVYLAHALGRDGATAVRLLLTPADAATALKGDPGISRRVAWTEPLPLDQVKRIAHDNGATVNDVLLAAVSGALRHYLQDHDSTVGEIQAMVPFNLRALDKPIPRELGNKFGLVFLPLPVGTSGGYRRLMEVHHRMQEIKKGRDGAVSYGLLSAAGLTPEPVERRIVDMFSAKGTAVMTNVPGLKQPVYLAGTPIRSVLVWAPTSGHIGMSVSIFSYRGEVTVGLMVDATLVPDPEAIIAQLKRELKSLASIKPPKPRHEAGGRKAGQTNRAARSTSRLE